MRELAHSVEAMDIVAAPLEEGEAFLMHRYPGVAHEDSEDCWCSPIRWEFQHKHWPLTAIQQRLDRFFCVH